MLSAPPELTDPDDPRLAGYRDLRDGKLKRRQGLFVAESRLVVARLLAGGRYRVRSILLTAAARTSLGDVLSAAPPDLPVYVAPPAVLRAVVGFDFHRGCLALAERGEPAAIDDLLRPTGPRCVLALDALGDPDNVGAVFRSALALGAAAVLLGPGCADPLYRKTVRTAVGATLALPFASFTDWGGALDNARAAGYTRVALIPDGDVDLAGLARPERFVLMVGSEGAGLNATARAAADLTVRIAMVSGVDSLNVAAATAIALHRLAPSSRT